MDNIIRNWVVSDIFQIAEGERDGHMYLTRPGMDYDVVLYLCEMEKLKCRGTQEQLEEAGFIKVGSATATKVHADKKVEVIAVNYYEVSCSATFISLRSLFIWRDRRPGCSFLFRPISLLQSRRIWCIRRRF